MRKLRKPVYASAGATSLFFGPGRKEFDPSKPMPSFETYLQATTKETLKGLPPQGIDEGILGSFMAAQFLHQANLPAFLPFMIPELKGKPCTGVEGACGTGGRAIAMGIRSVLSDLSDTVFVAGFEIQNGVKSIYGADILAGAAYYRKERKSGHAFFFPGIFAEKAGAYFRKYGEEKTRKALAKWYENAILNARKYPLAQEFHNTSQDLIKQGMTPPNPEQFLPYLNLFDCSKITDGASSLIIASEEGLKKLGIPKSQAVEIIALGEAEGDITKEEPDPTVLAQTKKASEEAFQQTGLKPSELGMLEVHDCFSITGLLMLEALGLAKPGKGADFVLDGTSLPINASGGLIGFGHPTGASGVRMLADLQRGLAGKKDTYGMMVSMGGDDKTVTSVIVKSI